MSLLIRQVPIFSTHLLGEYMKSFVSVVSALMVSLSMLAGMATASSAIAGEKVDCSKKENAEKKECVKK